MTTNNPEVQAILITCMGRDGKTILSRAVRLIENHDPSCVNVNWNYDPLVLLSDYQKMQTDLEEELFCVRQDRDSHFGEMLRAITKADALQTVFDDLNRALAESQANDRQAMYYLNQVREIVGGNDFPDMVARIKDLWRTVHGEE